MTRLDGGGAVVDEGGRPGRVLVTGGASGIGAATVDILSARGWDPVVLDLEAGPGGVSLDVADEHAWNEVADRLWPFSGLVNCAGIRARTELVDSSLAEFARTFEVNTFGPFLGMRTVARRWIAEGSPGAVVNVASVNGYLAKPGQAAYASSKAALIMLTRAAAGELSPRGIRVNAVAPGGVRTPMTEARLQEPGTLSWLQDRIPMGRVAEPREIAEAIAFLLSKEASYIAGTTLTVDGGWTTSL